MLYIYEHYRSISHIAVSGNLIHYPDPDIVKIHSNTGKSLGDLLLLRLELKTCAVVVVVVALLVAI